MKRLITCLLPGAAACLLMALAQPTPYLPEQLQLRVTIEVANDLGLPRSTTYNPRCFDGYNYVAEINIGSTGIGRYPSGSAIPAVVVENGTEPLEHRMLAPFRGAFRSTYMLGGSGAKSGGVTTTLSRYNFDGSNRVDAETPAGLSVEGFDWVDDDTIIGAIYSSGYRTQLSLIDVVAEPFSLKANTTWNPNGFVATSATTRIRNVRVGDKYPGYAYYGDAGQNSNPAFYAVNLATGAETLLGYAGELTGSGSYGLWTVLERGGYLYVQTTDNGVEVYNMTDATTLGLSYATYGKGDLDAITGYSGQYYGFDVSADATKLVLGAGQGRVYELGPPILGIARSATDVVLDWPESVTAVVIQSAPKLAAPDFSDLDPQPTVEVIDKMNRATIPIGNANAFYRLRKAP